MTIVGGITTRLRSNSLFKGKKKLRHSASMPLDLLYNGYDFAHPHDPTFVPAGERVDEPGACHTMEGTPGASQETLVPPIDRAAPREGEASSSHTVDQKTSSVEPMDSIESLRESFKLLDEFPQVTVMVLPDTYVVPDGFPTEDQLLLPNMTDEQRWRVNGIVSLRRGMKEGLVQGGTSYTRRQRVHCRTMSAGQSYSRPTHIAYPDLFPAQAPEPIHARVARSDLQRSVSDRVPTRRHEHYSRQGAQSVPLDVRDPPPRHESLPRPGSPPRQESKELHRSGSTKSTTPHSPLRRKRAQLELRPGHKPNALSDSVLTSPPERWPLLSRAVSASDRSRKLHRPGPPRI
ncbi:uncharacterized protein SCHCODRAFT_02549913 [Schizophyllum commune H4-8]|nr:uncharacterized protein SCHCODRAFT_02549913 [Schizophyllum commune H4-8]KAI5889609.1 hypothetical protein SCHCODRAFT_02549913 [Schizophyllum commune H4-8]